MDNMKARDFVESEVLLHLVPEDLFEEYSRTVEAMVAGARDAAFIVRANIRQAVFGDHAPSDGGALALARDRFWDRSERGFREVLRPLAEALENAASAEGSKIREKAREDWLGMLRRTTEDLFDETVPQTDFDALDLKSLEQRI